MTLYHNITLAVFTLLLALSAIGGETWKKDEPKAKKRITPRGWLSILLLLIICGVTIHKEIELVRRIQDMDSQRLKTERQLQYSQFSLLLHEKLQSTQETLSRLLEQKNTSVIRSDSRVEELKKEIQRYQKELITAHYLPKDSKRQRDINNPPPMQKQQSHKTVDDYHEITKPIIEVQ
jgi:hypothetical protein